MKYNARNKLLILVMTLLLPMTNSAWAIPSLKQGEAKVVQEKTGLEVYRGATSLSKTELVDLLSQVGFKGKALRTAWAVVMKESNGHPLSHNQSLATGDNSYGLFQINMLGDLGAIRREKFNIKTNEELLDPVTNAQAAFYMTAHGTDFGSWGLGPNAYDGTPGESKVSEWLKQFPS